MPIYIERTVDAVWEKAQVEEGKNPNIWRKDFAGAWIRRDGYCRRNPYGWEIDHVKPRSAGRSDELGNLLPLHWHNNRFKGDATPEFKTCITSEGNKNIERIKEWKLKNQ